MTKVEILYGTVPELQKVHTFWALAPKKTALDGLALSMQLQGAEARIRPGPLKAGRKLEVSPIPQQEMRYGKSQKAVSGFPKSH